MPKAAKAARKGPQLAPEDEEKKQIGVRMKGTTHLEWKSWCASLGLDYEGAVEFLLEQFPQGGKWTADFKAGRLKPRE